jgi:hypothetical protein
MFRIVLGHGLRRAAGIEEADDAVAAGDESIGVEHRRAPNPAYTADATDTANATDTADATNASDTSHSAYATHVPVPLLAGFLSVLSA